MKLYEWQEMKLFFEKHNVPATESVLVNLLPQLAQFIDANRG